MHRNLILFFLFNLMTLSAFSAQNNEALEKYLRNALPSKLQNVFPGSSTESEVKKNIGTPAKEKNNTLFYELSHIKYDTTIGIKNGTVDYIIYQFKPDRLTLNDLSQWISQEQAAKAINDHENESHESGREFEIDLPENGIKLIVSRSTTKRIKSVTIFSKNKK